MMARAAETVTVDGAERRRRVDRYLAQDGRWGSRSEIQRMITAGLVCVGGRSVSADYIVEPGDVISILGELPVRRMAAVAEDLPLTILYEDEDILVLDKPAPMVVHPAAGHATGTLVAAVLHHWGGADANLDPVRPGLVHRLDKDTPGVIVFAKTVRAHAEISQQFKSRAVRKSYLAFVVGCPSPARGTIAEEIGRHPVHRKRMAVRPGGRPAVTDYEVIEVGDAMALVQARPHTGRTHQIRVHFDWLGHPLVGDPVYGGRRARSSVPWLTRQALHAESLSIRHPRSGDEMEFRAALPDDLVRLRQELRRGAVGEAKGRPPRA